MINRRKGEIKDLSRKIVGLWLVRNRFRFFFLPNQINGASSVISLDLITIGGLTWIFRSARYIPYLRKIRPCSSFYVKLFAEWWKWLSRRLSKLTIKLNFQQPMVFFRAIHWEIHCHIISLANTCGWIEQEHLQIQEQAM